MSLYKIELPALAPLLESLLDIDQVILDALPMGVYACDSEGQILRVNRKAVELWGRSPRLLDPAQRFCGSFRVESLDGHFIPPDKTPMALAVMNGQSFEAAEAIVHNPDGTRWVARVNVAPLHDANGAVVGAINCFQDITREHEVRMALQRQQRTFDLAMVASHMGTWRYTFADNICVYDKNAQSLYGLGEARFLHDEEGVKGKFHPEDLNEMWARVASACDPLGSGQYAVEYRVMQADGNWRWLSAWGLVEFEGQGGNRKPIAIAGASRDLTELKRAAELQQLLINELNHRVKNTLATVQSLVSQTLRSAGDVGSARSAINARILSLARVHDLLTDRSWSGADIVQVVARATAPFSANRFMIQGASFDLPPKQALALSLALHELGTNAAKYGALSTPEGKVELRWEVREKTMFLSWLESGGPDVTIPSRRGFGSRLLEDALASDLGGHTKMEFEPSGVRCSIQAALAPVI